MNKVMTVKKSLSSFIFLFAAFHLFAWSDNDAAGGWNDAQRDEDNFYSGVWDGGGEGNMEADGSAETAEKILNSAMNAVKKMKEEIQNYTQAEIDDIQNNLEKAQEKYAQICAKSGKFVEYSTDGQMARVFDAQGNITKRIGDPVQIAEGYYYHDLEDFYWTFGSSSFEVKRTFKSNQEPWDYEAEDEYDYIPEVWSFFGKGWNSNLCTRIVRGENLDGLNNINITGSYKDRFDELFEKVKRRVEILSDYTEEDLKDVEEISDEEFFSEASKNDEDIDWDEIDYDEYVAEKCLPLYKKAYMLKERFDAISSEQYEIARKTMDNIRYNCYVRWGFLPDLEIFPGRSIIFIDEKGCYHILEKKDGKWQGNEKGDFTVKDDGNGLLVEYNSGRKIAFNKYGQPVKIIDKNGGVSVLTWKNEELQKVEINGGITVQISWRYGRIYKITDGKKSLNYSYINNLLSSVKDETGKTVNYIYDENFNIVSVVKNDGSSTSINYEEGEDGLIRVSSVKDEAGNSEYFKYDLKEQKTYYTDHDKNVSTFGWDDKFRTVSENRSDGTIIKYFYNDEGFLEKKIFNGQTFKYKYDESGRLVKTEYENGTADCYEYCGANLTAINAKDGTKLSFEYDENNFLVRSYNNCKFLYGFEYDEKGFLTKKTDCRGNITEYGYDSWGNLIKGGCEKWMYDEKNRISYYKNTNGIEFTCNYLPEKVIVTGTNGYRVTREFSSRGDLIELTEEDLKRGEKRVWNYFYDRCHRLIKGSLNGKTLRTFVYSPEGKLLSTVLYDISEKMEGPSKKLTSFFWKNNQLAELDVFLYDRNGGVKESDSVFYEYLGDDRTKVIRTLLIDGTFIDEYFEDGLKTQLSVNHQAVEKYCYNNEGLLETISIPGQTSRTVWAGGVPAYTEAGKDDLIEYEYYADNLLKEFTNSDGEKYVFSYDVNKNLIGEKSAAGEKVFEYDNFNHLTAFYVKDKTGKIIRRQTRTYSADGRTVEVTDGNYIKKLYEYDAFGNLVKIVVADKESWLYKYDSLNNLVEITNPWGKKAGYFYDLSNNLVRMKDFDGSQIDFEIDIHGKTKTITDDSGKLFEAEYDLLGRVKKLYDRKFHSIQTYKWDDSGRIINFTSNENEGLKYSWSDDGKKCITTDLNGRFYEQLFDDWGRIVSWKNSSGNTRTFSYKNGAVCFEKDFNGNQRKVSYSGNGLIVREDWNDGSFICKEWNYDGKIIRIETQDSRILYEYDLAGNLIKIKDGFSGETIEYSYDSSGNCISSGNDLYKLLYEWKNGLPVKLTDTRNNISIRFDYSENGREIGRIFSTGEKLLTWYDNSGKTILKAGFNSSGQLCFVNGNLYGTDGRIKYSVNSDFSITKYVYDSNGRLKRGCYELSSDWNAYFKNLCAQAGVNALQSPADTEFIHLSQGDCEELSKLICLIPELEAELNLSSQMITIDYEYDGAGNIKRMSTPWGVIDYAYNIENELIKWGEAGKGFYDKNGNLVERSDAFKKETFVYSPQNRIKEQTVYNLITGEAEYKTFKYDGLGRCIEQRNSKGKVFTTVYDGFGLKEFSTTITGTVNNGTENGLSSGRYSGINGTAFNGRAGTFNKRNVESENADELNSSGWNCIYDWSGNLAMLYHKGIMRGNGKINVIFADSSGTVLRVMNENSRVQSFDYDSYGNVIGSAALVYGFAGKRYDRISGFYDFGFRAYWPEGYRFSSVDPALDGLNWYAYCRGDPLNYVDKDGFKILTTDFLDMHDKSWENTAINGTSTTVGQAGCTVTAVSEIFSKFENDRKITPGFTAKANIYSTTEGRTDEVNWAKVGGSQYEVKKLSVDPEAEKEAAVDCLKVVINEIYTSKPLTGVALEVKYNNTNTSHWVTAKSGVISINGTNYVEITGTSIYDKNLTATSSRVVQVGWIIDEQKNVYVPLESIKSIVTVKDNKDN